MNTQTRRDVIRGVLGAGIVGGSGAVALRSHMLPTVSAQADIQNETLTGESPDGTVDEVRVSASGVVEWSNLPDSAQTVQAELYVEEPDGGYARLITDFVEANPGTREIPKPFEFDFPPQPIIELSAWEASDFSASSDGETNITQIPMRLVAVVFKGGGGSAEDRELVRDTVDRTVTVQVTNTEGNDNSDASVRGSMELGGYVEMQSDG